MSSSSTVAAHQRQLKLLVQSMSDKDIAKVEAFLRIGRERLHFDWKIVDHGELDVLMLGADEAHTVRGMLDEPMATLRVVDSHASRP